MAAFDATVGRHADGDGEQDQGEDVVDHGGAEHRARGAAAGDDEVEEGRRGDAGAGRGQRRAEEDAGLGALAERQVEPDPSEEGQDDADTADGERDPPLPRASPSQTSV